MMLVATLGSVYLYAGASYQLSVSKALVLSQESQIGDLDSQIRYLVSMLNSSREASELLNITSSFGIGNGRAHISLVGVFSSLFSRGMVNGTTETYGYIHQSEYAYVYSPRENLTLRVSAYLYESTRSIPIRVFRGSIDTDPSSLSSPLITLEAKPGAYNEFNVVLPGKGWYSVSSFDSPFFSDPKYDYTIHVELMMLDGARSIPFVIRSWELG